MLAFLLRPSAPLRTRAWLGLSLLVSLGFGMQAVRIAFSHPYVVQDDARQHVFWLERLLDAGLFPQDWIADYFQSVAPAGYTLVYRLLAAVGVHPLLAAKVLPLLLGLIATAYCFGTTVQLLPVPLAGFLATVLLNQNLVQADDLWSATPRAFLYPLFLAFLYYFSRRSLIPCTVAIALQGLFYPQVMFISVGVLCLALVHWPGMPGPGMPGPGMPGRGKWPTLSRQRRDYLFLGVGWVVAVAVVAVYILAGGTEFGPAIKAAQARQMPEFWGTGRGSFFNTDPLAFWITAGRSGILPHPDQLLKPPLLLIGLLLPVLLRWPDRFPLAARVRPRGLGLTVLSSVGLFFLAHAVVFRLHHPSRYTQHSFRVVLAIAAGISLTLLLDGLRSWAGRPQRRWRRGVAVLVPMGLAVLLAVYPWMVRVNTNPLVAWFAPTYLFNGYMVGQQPALYEFLAQQPKDIVIASLAAEANNLPTFAQRSILAGREYGIPYHVGYYQKFRERAIAQLQAHYSADRDAVRRFTEQYRIRFWLVEDAAFGAGYLDDKDWLAQYQPTVTEAKMRWRSPQKSVLELAIPRCTRFQGKGLKLLDAQCVVISPRGAHAGGGSKLGEAVEPHGVGPLGRAFALH